ncbi:hypothetical protein [Comamonas sp.]|uniref:hypothetical protein n=1 Tax=Comamonas sp. TaxID=34028 RepID=UPI0028A295FF|nr:hypothetical protein [Comamonas sp.]
MSEAVYFQNVLPNARTKVMEALYVATYAAADLHSDAVSGVVYLLEWLASRFEQQEAKHSQDLDDLSANACAALAVLSSVNESHRSQLLHAAETILAVAKAMLDDAIEKGGST